MLSDSDRLLADGVPIEMGGTLYALRYSMRSLKVLEDKFGGLTGVNSYIGGGDATNLVGPLADLIAAGLLHEGVSADDVLDRADPRQMLAYRVAAIEALSLAFPAAEPTDEDNDPKALASTGGASTSSPPPATGVLTNSSGT